MACKLSNLLVACVFALALGLANADEPEKIVGGLEATEGEIPYIVSLRDDIWHFCAGTIISDRHILTAAHCTKRFEKDVAGLKIVTGTNHVSKGGEVHLPKKVYIHPHYRTERLWYHDISVIELQKPIVFNARQNKVELPKVDPPRDIQALASGWGYITAPPKASIPKKLQKLTLNLLTTHKCQRFYKYPIFDDMICTLNAVHMGTCSGDSGGPLVYKNTIIGVVSGGIPCATGQPDIFTNVWWARHFIADAMAGKEWKSKLSNIL